MTTINQIEASEQPSLFDEAAMGHRPRGREITAFASSDGYWKLRAASRVVWPSPDPEPRPEDRVQIAGYVGTWSMPASDVLPWERPQGGSK